MLVTNLDFDPQTKYKFVLRVKYIFSSLISRKIWN